MKKRFLSIFLTLAMVLTFVPATGAAAADVEIPEGAYTISVDTMEYGTVSVKTPYAFAGDPVASNMNRTARHTQVVDLRVHLPEWLAERHSFKYESKITGCNANDDGYDVTAQTVGLFVNGQQLWSTNRVTKTSNPSLVFDVPNEMLVPGINVFRWTNMTETASIRENAWVCFDYQCLRAGKLRRGTCITVR